MFFFVKSTNPDLITAAEKRDGAAKRLCRAARASLYTDTPACYHSLIIPLTFLETVYV
jgi:hypothetical protein